MVEIIVTSAFQREAKKLLKKYRSLKSELEQLINKLEESPRSGTLISENIYKIRLAVKSKGKGKSGGMRVITYVVNLQVVEEDDIIEVYLVSIYDKSDFSTISQTYLKALIEEISSETEENHEE